VNKEVTETDGRIMMTCMALFVIDVSARYIVPMYICRNV